MTNELEVDDIELRLKKYNIDKPDLLRFKKTTEFNSIRSDLICVEYSDKLFISVSSTGKFGSVLFAKQDKVPGCEDDTIYTVKNLFGQSEPTLDCFTRSLVEKLNKLRSVTKPVLVCVSVTRDQLNRFDLFKHYETLVLELYSSKVVHTSNDQVQSKF